MQSGMLESAPGPDHNARVEEMLEKMQQNEGDAEIQARACESLAELGYETKISKLNITRAVKAACKAMARFPEHVEISISAIEFMCDAFQSDSNNAAVAAREGFVPVLLRAIRTNTTESDIQSLGCTLVNFFALSPCCHDVLWRENALGTVLNSMASHLEGVWTASSTSISSGSSAPSSPASSSSCKSGTSRSSSYVLCGETMDNEFMQNAYGCVINMFQLPGREIPGHVVKELTVILHAMAMHKESAELVELALTAISASAHGAIKNAEILGLEGVKSVLKGMRAHDSHEGVQNFGCRALSFMTRRSAERKKYAHEQGCVEWMQRIMLAYPANAELVRSACFSCACLMEGDDDDGYREAIANTGFIRTVTRALRTHMSDVTFAFIACETLQRFSYVKNIDHRSLLVSEGTCDAILTAMQVHKQHVDTVEAGCRALLETIMACRASTYAEQMKQLRTRAVPVILDIMPLNIPSETVIFNCAKVLAVCILNTQMVSFEREISNRDAISMLVRCLNAHPDHADLQQFVSRALMAVLVTSFGRFQDRCRETGAIEALLRAAVKFQHNAVMLATLRSTLASISESHAENTAYVMHTMTPQQAKILGGPEGPPSLSRRSGSSLSFCESMDPDILLTLGMPIEHVQLMKFAVANIDKCWVGDVVAKKLSEVEQQELAPGKEAAEQACSKDGLASEQSERACEKECVAVKACSTRDEKDSKCSASASVLSERDGEKMAETCSACGKTAQDMGLKALLRCSACTIAPVYCCVECQRICWREHKAECKANRIAGK
jgi:hypothetical protein